MWTLENLVVASEQVQARDYDHDLVPPHDCDYVLPRDCDCVQRDDSDADAGDVATAVAVGRTWAAVSAGWRP